MDTMRRLTRWKSAGRAIYGGGELACDDALRRKAAFTVARGLGNWQTRELLEANGYCSDSEVIVALETDTIEVVFERIRRYTPPVTVAVFWPESAKVEYASFKPGGDISDLGAPTEEVGRTATVGMLFEHVGRQSGGQFRFRLTWDQPAMRMARFATSLA
jgi:hypothetical protein